MKLLNFAYECFAETRTVCGLKEPKTFRQAMKSKQKSEWLKAITYEFNKLHQHGVLSVVDTPKDVNIVTSKWVFKIKRNSDGTIKQFRARLVARGFTQIHGVDFWQTFSPVARMESFRILIAIAAAHKYVIHHVDIKSAYLC